MKKKAKKKKDNSERWLLTYSDLITLLMILFVVLYAMSIMDKGKYENLSQSLNSALGDGVLSSGNEGGDSVIDPNIKHDRSVLPPSNSKEPIASSNPKPTATSNEDSNNVTNNNDMEQLKDKLGSTVSNLNSNVILDTSVTSNTLIISLKDKTAFESGEAQLTDKIKAVLDKIAPLLNRFGNQIIVEGHTDNRKPGKNVSYPTNWSLSTARACNVAEYLVEQGKIDGKRISAIGYGEYKPVVSNNTKEGRQKNRRVDIVILY